MASLAKMTWTKRDARDAKHVANRNKKMRAKQRKKSANEIAL